MLTHLRQRPVAAWAAKAPVQQHGMAAAVAQVQPITVPAHWQSAVLDGPQVLLLLLLSAS